jgi:hypothetical protein
MIELYYVKRLSPWLQLYFDSDLLGSVSLTPGAPDEI